MFGEPEVTVDVFDELVAPELVQEFGDRGVFSSVFRIDSDLPDDVLC